MKIHATLGTKISLGVSFILILILITSAIAFVSYESAYFERNIRNRAESKLSILEAVHTQAMLKRGNKFDGNPVIATLNGTLEQLSRTPSNMSLWMVMGPKVLAFQTSHGRSERDPPRDAIDSEALSSGKTVARIVQGNVFRLTRPVILGKGNGRHAKCAECHGRDMGIHDGEVMGAYAIALSFSEDQKKFNTVVQSAIVIAVLASIVIASVCAFLIKRLVAQPIAEMTTAMSQLAGGNMDLDIPFQRRTDEIGEMARSVDVFKDNAIERIRAEARARRHEVELLQVLRRSTMGEMASALAHELAQPIATIATYCGALSDRITSGRWTKAELTDVLHRISDMAHRASGITRTIADHVRGGDTPRISVDLNDMVGSLLPLIEADARENGVVPEFDAAERSPNVLMNRIEIESVVLNLVRNAIDAMRETEPGARILRIQTGMDANHAFVAVGDTGKGMESGVRDHVFEPFFTTKAESIGMGLAICRTIIEAHAGRFSIDTVPGKGTTFKFLLPLIKGDFSHAT